MVDVLNVDNQASDNQCRSESIVSDSNCPKCLILKEQLELITQELKSARIIISLLKDDIHTTPNLPSMDSQPMAKTQCATDLKWNTVTYKSNKKKVQIPNNIQKTDSQLAATRSSSSRVNLKVHQRKSEPTPVINSANSSPNRPRKTTTKTHKIPTIINGRMASKYNKHVHKVHIIGDSHCRGIATNTKQHLGSNFVVSSLIKPGAKVDQIVETQESDFECLGKKDLIIVNGGSNDLTGNTVEVRNSMSCLLSFAQKHENANVLILKAPVRYDPLANFKTNWDIMCFHDMLHKSTTLLDHVHLIEMPTDRKHFNNYGLHLNKVGKETLAKNIASKIWEIIGPRSTNEPKSFHHRNKTSAIVISDLTHKTSDSDK